MDGAKTMIFAGLGCRRDCSAQDVLAALDRCAAKPDALAAPDFKCHEPGLQAAAAALGLSLVPVARKTLEAAQSRCVTRSRAATAAVGLHSVAEAAALAAAGPGSRLLQARLAHGGATCALAETLP